MKRIRDCVFPLGRPLRWALPVLTLLILLLLQWGRPDWVSRAEAWTVDARFQLRGEEPPRFPIVVVALDEDSFQIMGDLAGENIRTWPRASWAELVTKIAAGEPRIIGMDVVFDTPGWDAGGDEALAQAIASAGTVVLAGHQEGELGADYQVVTLSPPIVSLAEPSLGIGLVNLDPDVDGVVRRTGVLFPWGGQDYPHFPLVVAAYFAGASPGYEQDLDPDDSSLPIHFRGPEATFTTISMIDVWLEESPQSVFEDAIVLVGFTTQLEQDRHTTPFGVMPGVEIQANAVDTLLAGDWLHRSPDWLPVALVALAGLVAIVAMNIFRPAPAVLILVGLGIGYLVLGWGSFVWADFLLPVVAPTATAVLVGGATQAERTIFAERDRRNMRRRLRA